MTRTGHIVAGAGDSPVRQRLQLALREALKARDAVAVSALRSALAAIDNAGAVPGPASCGPASCGPASGDPAPAARTDGPHFAGAAAGLGAGEAERRRLTEADIEQIVCAEVAERQAAVQDYDRAGHPDQAERLRHEARILLSIIGSDPPPSC
jgi:hypothetical protein